MCVESGCTESREFFGEGEIGVFFSPLFEVLPSAFLWDSASNEVASPISIQTFFLFAMCWNCRICVYEDAAWSEGVVCSSVESLFPF
tara:strand:- start:164 stop:424 length:261 start_codon:yes stop_codon:yes gene_type:complete